MGSFIGYLQSVILGKPPLEINDMPHLVLGGIHRLFHLLPDVLPHLGKAGLVTGGLEVQLFLQAPLPGLPAGYVERATTVVSQQDGIIYQSERSSNSVTPGALNTIIMPSSVM